MADRNILHNLNTILNGKQVPTVFQKGGGEEMISPDTVLFSTNDEKEYKTNLELVKQQKLLSRQWLKAGADASMKSLAGETAIRLMYRDADLMETFPEIGAALDIYQDEACNVNASNSMISIYSKSPRIKAVLTDLFINRLNINTTLPMICREMCKYGNAYQLLNINLTNGIVGWKRLPPYEITRVENGYSLYTNSGTITQAADNFKQDEVTFIWEGYNNGMPFKDWNIAHFRMLNDSFFLPYGVSILHKARRAWRMLSMMEDAMLVYRLERSVERRVFKIFVGEIDNADVPAYVQQIANNFKRTQLVDPETGQLDLRKSFADVSSDYFIPVRREDAPTPIENLSPAQNPTTMDDIKYEQNKILSALLIPKSFLNFSDAQGKGQNLSLLDIRFCRRVNKIQQYLLLELNKVAMTHLSLLGFEDDVTNFTLTMNNPSAQIEALELEDLTKRIQTASAALSDPGIGMPIMSLHRVLKQIMKMTDEEIKDMLQEIRIEKAMAAELALTNQVIKKTGMFDAVDNIYGDPNAKQNAQPQPQQQEGGMGAPGGGGGGMGVDTNSLNMNSLGGGDIPAGNGEEGEAPIESAPQASPDTLNERKKSFMEQYFQILERSTQKEKEESDNAIDYIGKSLLLKESISDGIKELGDVENNMANSVEDLLNEVAKIKDSKEIDAVTGKTDNVDYL